MLKGQSWAAPIVIAAPEPEHGKNTRVTHAVATNTPRRRCRRGCSRLVWEDPSWVRSAPGSIGGRTAPGRAASAAAVAVRAAFAAGLGSLLGILAEIRPS